MEANALREALEDDDFEESRYRADLIKALSLAGGLPAVRRAATLVVNRLGKPGEAPMNGTAQAMQELLRELHKAVARLDFGRARRAA